MSHSVDSMTVPATSQVQRPLMPPGADESFGGDGIGFADLISGLRYHWRTIVGTIGLTIAVVLAVTMVTRMTFIARGSLYLGELQGTKAPALRNGLPEQLDVAGDRNGDVGTEVEILRSRDLVNAAILEAGLSTELLPAEWSPPPYLRWRLSRRDVRILDGARHVRAIRGSLGRGPRLRPPSPFSFPQAARTPF